MPGAISAEVGYVGNVSRNLTVERNVNQYPDAFVALGTRLNAREDEWFDIAQFRPQEPFTLRTLPTRVADLRGPGVNKWDFTISKSLQMSSGMVLKPRVELYNAFNRTNFGNPNTTLTSSNFGRITGTSFGGPREIQLAARLEF